MAARPEAAGTPGLLSMARHWIATDFGSPDTWRFEEYDVPTPAPGEVTIRVLAAGVNPADAKHVARARPGAEMPTPIGYEISGVLTAIGPDTEIVTGPASVGDEVIAFRVRGGYATEITVPAQKVLRKPAPLTHPEAANLLLAGTTAAEMLDIVRAEPGETILLHDRLPGGCGGARVPGDRRLEAGQRAVPGRDPRTPGRTGRERRTRRARGPRVPAG